MASIVARVSGVNLEKSIVKPHGLGKEETRGDEAQRRSHPGLVDGGYQLKIVKHAPARRTSVDEIVFGHDLDGDGCCDDLEAAGVGLCAAGRSLF